MLSPQYCAGLFDGEGCICLVYSKRGRRRNSEIPILGFAMRTLIANTHLGVLEQLRARYGGHIHASNRRRPSHHRKVYSWVMGGKVSQQRFLRSIQPFAIVRGEHIALALRYLATVVKPGHRLSRAQWTERLEVAAALSALNVRGRALQKRIPPNKPPEGWRPTERYSASDLRAIMEKVRAHKRTRKRTA